MQAQASYDQRPGAHKPQWVPSGPHLHRVVIGCELWSMATAEAHNRRSRLEPAARSVKTMPRAGATPNSRRPFHSVSLILHVHEQTCYGAAFT